MDELEQRLLDMNRTIGQPKKITIIFGRKVTKEYKGKLQTVIEDLDLPNPVIRSHYAHGFAKQYVRDNRLLRTEPATNDVRDYGVNKDVENLFQHSENPSSDSTKRPRSEEQASHQHVFDSGGLVGRWNSFYAAASTSLALSGLSTSPFHVAL